MGGAAFGLIKGKHKMNNWLEKLNATFIEGERYKWLFEGFLNTLLITFGALIIGVIIGNNHTINPIIKTTAIIVPIICLLK